MEIVLVSLSIMLIVSVFLSLVRNDFWVFKILEYPRLQKLCVIIIVVAVWFYQWPETMFHWVIVAVLSLCIFYLLYKIWPYTALAKKRNADSKINRQTKRDQNIFG